MTDQNRTAEALPHEWASYSPIIGYAQCEACGKLAFGRSLLEPCRWWNGNSIVWSKPDIVKND